MFARTMILIIAPAVLAWVFLSTLWGEVRNAPRYAWWECQSEFQAIRAAWRSKSIRSENWK